QEAEIRRRAAVEEENRRAESEAKRRVLEQQILTHIEAARSHFSVQQYETALEEIERAFQLEPQHMETLQLRSQIWGEKAKVEKKRQEEELLRLQEAEKKRKEKEERKRREGDERQREVELAEQRAREEKIASYLKQAEELLHQEKFDKARGFVEKAFELDPRDPRTPNMYTRIREGMLAARQRKMEEDAKQRATLKRIQTYLERAQYYFARGKLEKALDEGNEALALDPVNAEVKQFVEKIEVGCEDKRKAEEAEKRKRGEEARWRFEEEARRRQEEEERRRREEEERQRAAEESKRQAKIRRIEELVWKAEEHLRKDKFHRALEEIESVYVLDPENLRAKQVKETIERREWEKRRSVEEARQRAEEEARRRTEEEERQRTERRIRGLIESARDYLGRGKLEKALGEVNSAYTLDPMNAEIKQLVEKIERAIEDRRRTEEEQKRKREEDARCRFEEETRRETGGRRAPTVGGGRAPEVCGRSEAASAT
ncbi:MAG: hypothetical protein AABZ61_09445, partial [Bacteroidota bacterium]